MMTKLYSADKFEGNNDMRMLLLRPPQMLRTIPLSIFNCIAGNTDTHFILDSEHTETHSLDVEAGNRLTRLKNRAKGLISPANTVRDTFVLIVTSIIIRALANQAPNTHQV